MKIIKTRRNSMNLPRDMLTEVICKLPISTLYKIFKAPSLLRNKELHSIISEPNFPHLFQSYQDIHPCSFLAYNKDETFLVEYDPNCNECISTRLNMDFLLKNEASSSHSLVLASCNGWLLVRLLRYCKIDLRIGGSCFPTESMFLVNPVTLRYVTIIQDESTHNLKYKRHMLGYIPKTRKYKVVRFSADTYEILTVNIDGMYKLHWRRTTSSNDPLYHEFTKEILDNYTQEVVMLEGALFCLVDQQTQILKFDLDKEEFELISTPYKAYGGKNYDPVSCRGYLGVASESLYMIVQMWSGVDIWAKKEEGWTKLTSIYEWVIPTSFELVRVLANDKILILSHKDNKLHICDPKEHKIVEEKGLEISGIDKSSIECMSVFKVEPSFLSLKDRC